MEVNNPFLYLTYLNVSPSCLCSPALSPPTNDFCYQLEMTLPYLLSFQRFRKRLKVLFRVGRLSRVFPTSFRFGREGGTGDERGRERGPETERKSAKTQA
ncbi:hypothetical protein RUM43_004704 [Polyplax serrata]|uniref:Uncharacterized protein n=1 Tax=Polyplax serrata TaxID=468196 RepID=A0AAN8SB56_POLSC